MRDNRIHKDERANDGACAACGRRHIHKDDCPTLKRRNPEDISGSLRTIVWHPTSCVSSDGPPICTCPDYQSFGSCIHASVG